MDSKLEKEEQRESENEKWRRNLNWEWRKFNAGGADFDAKTDPQRADPGNIPHKDPWNILFDTVNKKNLHTQE